MVIARSGGSIVITGSIWSSLKVSRSSRVLIFKKRAKARKSKHVKPFVWLFDIVYSLG